MFLKYTLPSNLNQLAALSCFGVIVFTGQDAVLRRDLIRSRTWDDEFVRPSEVGERCGAGEMMCRASKC